MPRFVFVLLLLALYPASIQAQVAEPAGGDSISAQMDSILRYGLSVRAHVTAVRSAEDNTVRLQNGAVVDIPVGYIGYTARGTDAVLMLSGYECRLWLQGNTHRCSAVRSPRGEGTTARLTFIADVRADGSILELGTGQLYEVLYEDYITSSWCCGEALVIGESRVLNLTMFNPPVAVTPID